MSPSAPDPDHASLTRSPYDPEPDLGENPDEIPWKIPVIAAIAGALAVAIFAIYAIVTGPGVEEVSNDELISAPTSLAQPTDDLPSGYVLIAEDVGARVESWTQVPSATFVFVSTAVPGSVEAATVRPPEVAFWELVTSAGTFTMQDQFGLAELTGSEPRYMTVEFPPDVATSGAELLAYIVETVAGDSTKLELSPDLPAEVAGFRIELADGPVIVVDSLQITDEGAYVEWRVEGGLTARLDVIVRFAGTGTSGLEDTGLVPEYADDSLLDASIGTDPTPLLYSFGSQYRLVRLGAPVDPDNPPTGLSVEFRVTAVTSVAGPVALPIG
ncbi:MAG: hypothetical protein ACC654_07510 [Acidimicrobiia bacterium]